MVCVHRCVRVPHNEEKEKNHKTTAEWMSKILVSAHKTFEIIMINMFETKGKRQSE